MNSRARSRLRLCLAVTVLASAALLTEGDGEASTPVSIYAAVSHVEMLPTPATATEVVIHGAFMFIDGSGNYADAVCGTMYFRCPSGSESLCRMQWLDIQTMGTAANQCAGFGSQNVVSTAQVRPEGAALVSPDTWDLGVGVQLGSHISGKCAPAKLLACATPTSLDAGAIDAPLAVDSAPALDSRSPDGSASMEVGARDGVGAEAGLALDAGARTDTPSARDAPAVDVAPGDAPRPLDAATADRPVADVPVAGPDASADLVAVTARDADLGNKDASGSGNSSDSDGCGCRLGGPAGRGRGAVPIGLAFLAVGLGVLAIRRVR